MKHELEILLNKHLDETLSEAERLRVAVLLREPDNQLYLTALLDEQLNDEARSLTGDPATGKRILENLVRNIERVDTPRIHFLKTAWFRYAAVLLLIAGTAIYLYKISKPQQEVVTEQGTTSITAIRPGGDKATLTLSDGRTILLDSAANGTLADQGATKIIKLTDGSLAYQAGNERAAIGYNTISTPKGGQYQINLSDGSKVWLNAASSIRFPTAFDKERRVVITGEAYLEIATDRKRPFYAEARGEVIRVLGTAFNVNAYLNQPVMTTTLLEGSVQIGNTLLKPGDSYAAERKFTTPVERAVAWKNGLFNFQDAGLREVMRQLERWYDIEVIIPPSMPETYFGGEMSRKLPLEEVLLALKGFGLKFRMEGRQLKVID